VQKYYRGSADLQVLEPAVQSAHDRGIVPADVEDLEPLQVEVWLRALANISFWGYQGVEGPGAKRRRDGDRSPASRLAAQT
jgi:hypothetical protein